MNEIRLLRPCRALRLPLLSTALLLSCVLWTAGCTIQRPNNEIRALGLRHLEAGELDRAEEHFALAIQQDRTDWRALNHMARVLLAKDERMSEAQRYLEQAIELRGDHPETPVIVDKLAETLYRQDKTEQLVAMLEGWTQRSGKAYDFKREARYLALIGDVDGASLAFRKAAHFASPTDAEVFVMQGEFYESVGDRQRAINALRHAWYVNPDYPGLADKLRNLGIVPGPTVGVPPDRRLLPDEE